MKRTDPVSGELGSVLMLMPAAVLVLIVLAAIAVDAAVVFAGQRQLADAAAAAANDAAVAALSEESFYACGDLAVDVAEARRVAADSYRARTADIADPGAPTVSVGTSADGQDVQVTVAARAQVPLIFAPALPGASGVATVTAAAVASAVTDPNLSSPVGTC